MKKNTSSKKSAVAIALALSLLLMAVALPALADTYGTVRNPNGGSYVNVRSWPSYDADILMRLSVGASVQITGTTGAWYSVWVDGLVGYIHSNFISVQGGSITPGSWATVRSGPLNLREAPSMRARVITQLPTGYRVDVLEEDGTWTKVQAGQTLGYVVTSYLSINGGGVTPAPKPPIYTTGANATIQTAGGNLNLRENPSSASSVIDSYGNGSRVRVISQQSGGWSYVQAGDRYGYMSSTYLRMDSGGIVPPIGTTGFPAVVNNPVSGQSLNLREQPSTTSRILGQYYNGTRVSVVGVGTEWHRVQIDGNEGYMMAQYLRFEGSGATPHKTVTGGTGGFVNLRSGAGYNFAVTLRVNNGSAASVVIPYPTWSLVLVRQGAGYTQGYMLNTFLK